MCSMPKRARIRPTTVSACDPPGRRPWACERPSRPGRCTRRWATRSPPARPAGHQHGVGRLLRPELGVEQPLRRVIEHGEQRLALSWAPAAIRDHCRPGAGARRQARGTRRWRSGPPTPLTRPAACGRASRTYTRASRRDPAGRCGEVADIEALVRARRAAGPADSARAPCAGQPPAPPVEQAQDRISLIAGPPASQTARMDAQDVGRLEPGPRAGHCAHDHLLVRHGPLHGGCRNSMNTSLAVHGLPAPPEKRTLHVLSERALCAPYTAAHPDLPERVASARLPPTSCHCRLGTRRP